MIVVIPIACICVFSFFWAMRTPEVSLLPHSRIELVGTSGVALCDIGPDEGVVRANLTGEQWCAISEEKQHIRAGQAIVISSHGLTRLTVTALQEEHAAPY